MACGSWKNTVVLQHETPFSSLHELLLGCHSPSGSKAIMICPCICCGKIVHSFPLQRFSRALKRSFFLCVTVIVLPPPGGIISVLGVNGLSNHSPVQESREEAASFTSAWVLAFGQLPSSWLPWRAVVLLQVNITPTEQSITPYAETQQDWPATEEVLCFSAWVSVLAVSPPNQPALEPDCFVLCLYATMYEDHMLSPDKHSGLASTMLHVGQVLF